MKPITGKSVTVKANAKINLTLGITGKCDDGYHLIDTVMHSVSLYDTVTAAISKKITARFTNRQIPTADNMVLRAARLFFDETGIKSGARIKVKNRIPTSSGMGGGSADAAAVLTALNRLYKTELSDEALERMGLKLGADVPFFIRGGAMRAEGIGERLSVLKPLEDGFFVLIKQGSKPSTAEMYSVIDSAVPPLPDTERATAALERGDIKELSHLLVNSFCAVWNINDITERLKAFNPDGISLSGSGPTVFALFSDKSAAKKAYTELKKQYAECYFAVPEKKAVIFE